MASTKGSPIRLNKQGLESLRIGIHSLKEQLESRIAEYERQSGNKIGFKVTADDSYDYINPQHYVQDDGRQTWEHMVDEFGLVETAIFCKLNAYKYRDRMGKKPNESTEREMKKVKWYEDKAAELYALAQEEQKKGGGFFSM